MSLSKGGVLLILFGLSSGMYVHADDQSQDSENKHMRAVEGSQSRYSGQLNLTYYGSVISDPFSPNVPNPGNDPVPEQSELQGTAAFRYRFNPATSVGLGVGVDTITPFQNPQHTAIYQPQADLSYSYAVGKFKNRVDVLGLVYTSSQYRVDYGYLWGFTLEHDTLYTISRLTLGLVFAIDGNGFGAAGAANAGPHQVIYDVDFYPFLEYAITSRINLRTLVGVQNVHSHDLSGDMSFEHPEVYQTLGVGISVIDDVFLYPYVRFFPDPIGGVSHDTTLVGMNAIINLF